MMEYIRLITFVIIYSFQAISSISFLDSMPINIVKSGHAQELLGNDYEKSLISKTKFVPLHINEYILGYIKQILPTEYKSQAWEISHALINESLANNLDPFFIMALISGESSFNPRAKGGVGEIGLMQLRPSTAKWITTKNKLVWKGKNSLYDPIENIKIGVSYISWMRERFDNHAQLYLAAYNMGGRNVKRALAKNIWPKDYAKHVMKRYFDIYKDYSITIL